MQNYNFLLDVEKKLDVPAKEFEAFRKSELLLSRFFHEQIKQLLVSINVQEINKLLGTSTHTSISNNSNVENDIMEKCIANHTGNNNEVNNNDNIQSERKKAFGNTTTIAKEQNDYTKGSMENYDVANAPSGNKSNEGMSNETTKHKNDANEMCTSETPHLFIPIDEKTFNDVPALTRRRAKLEDVNKVYKTLYEMAIKAGSCKPVEKLELQNMNLQVFGQTGEAKLATLRYLKIIEIINKNGSVKLLECAGIKKKRKKRGTFIQ